MHQAAGGPGRGADADAPAEAAGRGPGRTADHRAAGAADSRAFRRFLAGIGFDVLLGQGLTLGDVFLRLRFADLLQVGVGVEDRAGGAAAGEQQQGENSG